jgi:hypothetical protein
MRRDIKVNYAVLDDIVLALTGYTKALEDMRQAIGAIDALLATSSGEAVEALGECRVPRRNQDLSIIEPLTYRAIDDPKTVYDPDIISDQQMFDWGKEAMENIVYGDGTYVEGIASNGLRFRGHYDANGEITDFYPTIPQ